MSKKVVILKKGYNLAKDVWEKLAQKHSLELIQCEASSEAEYMEYFKDGDVIAIANTVPGVIKFNGYTEKIYSSLGGVKCIAHQGAGYDTIDAVKCNQLGIQVSNTPEAVQTATADLAIYLTLGVLRNFNQLGQSCREGKWLADIPLGDEAEGKTLGILGLGGIGALYRDKALSFLDFDKVQYHNRKRASLELEKDSVYVEDLSKFLATSDIIYVSVPLNKLTYHLINKEALDKCKDGSYIINTARGPVIDEQALVDALDSGKIKSVGLDVYENEPKIHPGLIAHPQTVLLPHAGTHTTTARRKMEKQVIANIDSFLSTGKVVNIVPECEEKRASHTHNM